MPLLLAQATLASARCVLCCRLAIAVVLRLRALVLALASTSSACSAVTSSSAASAALISMSYEDRRVRNRLRRMSDLLQHEGA